MWNEIFFLDHHLYPIFFLRCSKLQVNPIFFLFSLYILCVSQNVFLGMATGTFMHIHREKNQSKKKEKD